jgi:hypothetical protein
MTAFASTVIAAAVAPVAVALIEQANRPAPVAPAETPEQRKLRLKRERDARYRANKRAKAAVQPA